MVFLDQSQPVKLQMLLLSFAGIIQLHSQTLFIPYHPAPVIDGIKSPGEWITDSIQIDYANGGTTVYVQHDSSNLYICYIGNLESASRFPEVNLDINYDQSTNWQNDDWWFHVSATDCYFQGNFAVYSNCQSDHPDWEAHPNMTSSPTDPPVDTIEIRIPFSTINLSLVTDTFGLLLNASNPIQFYGWPISAQQSTPSTWGKATFHEPKPTLIKNPNPPKIKLFPNPTTGSFWIETPELSGSIRVYNQLGEVILDKAISDPISTVQIPKPGLYWVTVAGKNWQQSRKVLIQP